MLAALQPFVDNVISKTINIPEDFDFDSYRSIYERAFELGPKGSPPSVPTLSLIHISEPTRPY